MPAVAGQNIYFRTFTESTDTAGPEVTDVLAPDGSVLNTTNPLYFDSGGLKYMVLDFDEEMMAGDPTTNPDSILNPANFILSRNGAAIANGVVSVQYGMNKAYQVGLSPLPTNKWEAVLTLDANSLQSGNQALGTGVYTIQVRTPQAASTQTSSTSGVRDRAGNPLNSNGNLSNGASFTRQFSVVVSGVDNSTSQDPGIGGGTAQNAHTYPESTRAVAVAPNGIQIAVWTATYTDSTGASYDRVYFRLYDDNGAPAALPLLVKDTLGNYIYALDSNNNPIVIANVAPVMAVTPRYDNGEVGFTAADLSFLNDNQRFATVACDGDGDFVVTWTNIDSATGNAGNADVYARHFNSMGLLKGVYSDPATGKYVVIADTLAMIDYGDAFQVNDYTVRDQKWSKVAMDSQGDFIITWSSYNEEDSQGGTGFGVYAKRYNSSGSALGTEFRVNITTAGNQQNSSVALADNGRFMIVWQSDQNGGQYDIFGRLYHPDGTPGETTLTGEYQLNVTTSGSQLYPDVAIDPSGANIVVVWQSAGQDGSGWGIYETRFQVFDFSTVYPYPYLLLLPTSFADLLVNTTTTGDQMYPSLSMARDGTFTVAWCGIGNQSVQSDTSGYGVFYQRFGVYDPINLLENPIQGEMRANTATTGNQWIPSIGTDAVGNLVILYTGVGATAGSTDVYKHLIGIAVDTIGPIVTGVLRFVPTDLSDPSNPSNPANRTALVDGNTIPSTGTDISQLIVLFDENLSILGGVTGQHSVINPQNWKLYLNNSEIVSGIQSVTFGWNPLTRKYEAVLNLDGNGLSGGAPALQSGDYILVVNDQIWDASLNLVPLTGQYIGNALDGDLDGQPGTLTATLTGQSGYAFHITITTITATTSSLAEFMVNSADTAIYQQSISTLYGSNLGLEETRRAVAIDHSGDFAVVWTSFGQDDTSDPNGAGVYMRVFDRNNNPIGDSLYEDIQVNTTTAGNQRNASVAMDADGDFVVVWEGPTTSLYGSGYDIYARRFDSMGKALGGEFRVNSNYTNDQLDPAVAMDPYGNFVVVWTTVGQPYSYFNDIHGQLFDYNGQRLGNEFRVNSQNIPGTGTSPAPPKPMPPWPWITTAISWWPGIRLYTNITVGQPIISSSRGCLIIKAT